MVSDTPKPTLSFGTHLVKKYHIGDIELRLIMKIVLNNAFFNAKVGNVIPMIPKCYIITFYFNPARANPTLQDAIIAYGTWARISETTWAIITTQSATEVRDALETHLRPLDRLFVVKSGREAAWQNVECSSEWLKTNL